MRRDRGGWRLLRILLLIGVVGLAVAYGSRRVGRRDWAEQPTFRVRAGFRTVAGVEVGSRVRVQGIDAGLVEAVEPPSAPGGPVVLRLRVDERLRPLVRSDASARISMQGVIGSKIVELVPGRPDAPPLAASGSIRAEEPIELADLVNEASATLKRVDLAARSAERGMAEVADAVAAVRAGQGTLGKLVRDDDAYRKLNDLGEKGARTLDALTDNLAAIKRTWPLSRHFEGQGYYERDRLLYQPGSERASRTIAADDLFRPGGAILTPEGRRRLDEVGAWFNQAKQPKSEVVIAAFTDDPGPPDPARILTQAQADAVRGYLVGKFGIGSVGWFGSRKVAAVGFGAADPGAAPGGPAAPPRRVEVILFTPKA